MFILICVVLDVSLLSLIVHTEVEGELARSLARLLQAYAAGYRRMHPMRFIQVTIIAS